MSIDTAALKAELTTDPKTLGYAALVAANDTRGLADLLGKVGASRETLPIASASAHDAMAFLARADLAALSATDREYISDIAATGTLAFQHPAAVSAQNPTGSTQLLSDLLTVFPNTTHSGQVLRALINQPCSRAEALAQQRGTTVTAIDVATALEA